MRIKTLSAAAAAAAQPWGRTGLPLRARCGPWRWWCRRGGRGGLGGADTGRSPALPPGCGRGARLGSARLGQGKEPPRQGDVGVQAGRGTFRFWSPTPVFPFSSSFGLLGAAGLGEQRGPTRSKGSPEAGRCRGRTGCCSPSSASEHPPGGRGEPSPVPSKVPAFPVARQTRLAAVTRVLHRPGGDRDRRRGGAGSTPGCWARGPPWRRWATAASHPF